MIPKWDFYKDRHQLPSDHQIKPGLERIRQALQQLDQPQRQFSSIHFAGTNGKGSTLTFTGEIVKAHHLKVGEFMSPCVRDVHDQIQVNGQPITEQQMDLVFQQMSDAKLHNMLTDFELLTCAAFLHFRNERVDIALIEAGMGGREDSTNVIMPVVSVITSIAQEHTNFLGNTIEEIARHKAGIVKHKRPIVVGTLPIAAQHIVEQEALHQQAPLYTCGHAFTVVEQEGVATYRMGDTQVDSLHRQLKGVHQLQNLALAITAFLEFAKAQSIVVDVKAIQRGIAVATLENRFEQLLPNVIFDGAHNPASAEALVQTIQQQYPTTKPTFIIGMLADKDVATVMNILEPLAKRFYVVDFRNERALPAKQFIARITSTPATIVTIEQALQLIREKGGLRIVTGSLYLLSVLRNALHVE